MALLLRRGDPLPALTVATGKLDLARYSGRYWAIVTGPQSALEHAALAGLPLVATTPDAVGMTAARRLGADFIAGEPQPLVVLLDPAGTVVQSWADAPLPSLLALAQAKADELAGK